MSGGHFDYKQFAIDDIADQMELLIAKNGTQEQDEYGCKVYRNFNEATLDHMKDALLTLRKASIYTHRIDYLVSSDDSELTFVERLAKELGELEQSQNKNE